MIRPTLSVLITSLFVCTAPSNAQSSSNQAAAVQQAATAQKFTPRFDPVTKTIEGWEVSIDPALLDGEHQEAGAKALAMLANHLQRISILVPAEPLAALKPA